MPITAAQAEVLKQYVDEDANLAGANLQLKDIPDYRAFEEEYEAKFKKPSYRASNLTWTRYWNRKDRMWLEVVNKSLLPENIVGACVIGGLTMAALKAGFKVQLSDLLAVGGTSILDSTIPLDDVGKKTKKVLQEFTGLSFEELLEMQRINDLHEPETSQYWDEKKEEYVENPVYGKSEEECTIARRTALKAYLDSITV